MYENCYILIPISLRFFPNGPIDIGSDSGLAPNWRQAVISEPMMTFVSMS